MSYAQKISLWILLISAASQVTAREILAVPGELGYPEHVVINEILASNSRSNYDGDFGEYSDWVELYNPTSQNVDLEGWSLSDDGADPGKWRIPAGTVIPAGGYLLFWADGKDLRPGQKAGPSSPNLRKSR